MRGLLSGKYFVVKLPRTVSSGHARGGGSGQRIGGERCNCTGCRGRDVRTKAPDHDVAIVCGVYQQVHGGLRTSSDRKQSHSPDPETIMSSLSWSEVTAPRWPVKVWMHLPDSRSHTLTVRSCDAEAIRSASTSTLQTPSMWLRESAQAQSEVISIGDWTHPNNVARSSPVSTSQSLTVPSRLAVRSIARFSSFPRVEG